MPKEDRLQIRVAKQERRLISQDAETAGFDSTSAFFLWLWRNWRNGKLPSPEGMSTR